jgi:anti-sigma B factor antagonist
MSTAPSLNVGEDLTVYAVHALKPQLLAALDTHGSLHLDLSDVSEADGAGIQLLLAARNEAVHRGGAFSVSGVSAPVKEALTLIDQLDTLEVHP